MAGEQGDASREAQAAKQAAERRKQVADGRDLLWQYRALIAKHGVEVPPDLDRQGIAWLREVTFDR